MADLDLSELSDWISKASDNGAVVVVTHRNGDMDTIGSGLVLAQTIGPSARACGVHIGTLAKRMMKGADVIFHSLDSKRPILPRNIGGIIVVDSASPGQIGFDLPDSTPLCIIDHHGAASEEWPGTALLINRDTSSTAEIIWELIKITDNTISPLSGRLLLAAIVADTGRFKHARPGCYQRVEEIIAASGIDVVDVINEMESEDLNQSQRIAILHAVSNSKCQTVANIVVATTRARTHEGAVAHALLAAGAHVALVQKKTTEGMRMTGRASRTATNLGVDLGRVMSGLTTRLGGEGGGHPGAAGWSGEANAVELESASLAALSAELMD